MHKSHAHDSVSPKNTTVIGKTNGHAAHIGMAMEIVTHDLPSDAVEQWGRIREVMQAEMGEANFRAWIVPIMFGGLEGDEVLLYLETKFLRDHVQTHCGARLTTLWQARNPLIRRIDFRVDRKAKPPAPVAVTGRPEPTTDPAFVEFEPMMRDLGQRPPPALPLHLFGGWWGRWLEQAARHDSAPPDYFALPLLSVAAACIGHSRHAQRILTRFSQPPFLWTCCVGGVSSRKSNGVDTFLKIVPKLEAQLGIGLDRRRTEWETKEEVARQSLEGWKRAVAAARKKGVEPPFMPDDARSTPEPEAPRLMVGGITGEAMFERLENNPRGLLMLRDELSSWFNCFNRYNPKGEERELWINCYNGGSDRQDRKHGRKLIVIDRMGAGVAGTTQPENVAGFLGTKEDGLQARLLWCWPGKVHYPGIDLVGLDTDKDVDGAMTALRRLVALPMQDDADGRKAPVMVRLTEAADRVLDAWMVGQDRSEENERGGKLGGAFGKGIGQVLRLSLVLELLWWSAPEQDAEEDLTGYESLARAVGQPPSRISERALRAAIELSETYFWPMALQVYGENAFTIEEQNAQRVARWLVKHRPAEVNARSIRHSMRTAALKEAHHFSAALRVLEETGWVVRKPSGARPQGGRQREDYLVNLEAIERHWPTQP